MFMSFHVIEHFLILLRTVPVTLDLAKIYNLLNPLSLHLVCLDKISVYALENSNVFMYLVSLRYIYIK